MLSNNLYDLDLIGSNNLSNFSIVDSMFFSGFAKKTEVRELIHETAYKFRLRFSVSENNNSEWSPITEVVTKSKTIVFSPITSTTKVD